jgi:hypothetical protein
MSIISLNIESIFRNNVSLHPYPHSDNSNLRKNEIWTRILVHITSCYEHSSRWWRRRESVRNPQTHDICEGGSMTVKSRSHRSISDLEESIKHEVSRHQNQHSATVMKLNDLLHDEEALYAYCDSSVVNGCFHLGVSIVGLGTCRLYATSVSTQFPQYTILGELHAIRFSIGCLRDFLTAYGKTKDVHSMYVFSDVDHIEQLLRTNSRRAHQSIRDSVRRLRRTIKRLNNQFSGLTANVLYIGTPAERNLYYRSAHRAARQRAGIRR